MKKEVQIEIPENISFLDLNIKKDDDGTITYDMSILKKMLVHNGFELKQFTQDDIENILTLWYINHRKNGGTQDKVFERMFSAVANQPRFEPVITWDAVLEPPTPEQIAELRSHTGMTQQQVANMLSLSNRQLIGDYERGTKSPNPQTWTLWLLLTGQHPMFELIPRDK